ncbi:MAG: molybdopterin biosynthesis protein, partial [Haloarculaceae archaeon]
MSDRKEFRDLATPAEAREAVASLDLGGGTESVPLADARGRVLAERVDAGIDVPGFDRASMDGYAVRARDTFGAGETDPVVLPLVGSVHAGERPAVSLDAGEAAEISTGAVMPDGADAVVMVERTTERSVGEGVDPEARPDDEPSDSDRRVAIEAAVTPGENVMRAGADVAAGERALGPGTRVTAREVGLLSALGVDAVPVRARPRVGIVSTGDELVPPGEPLDSGGGQIHDVNTYAVAAGVEAAGGEPTVYPRVGDAEGAMADALATAARECDLVLTSGSTSASAVDVVHRAVEERGETLVHGIAVKPGKPTIIGRVDDAAYVGLPGYPVSALSIFRAFVAPAIREAAGLPPTERGRTTGTMARDERFEEGRRRLLPVGLVTDGEGKTLVYPVDKGSGATTSLTEADGVVSVGADANYLAAGEAVDVDLFSPDVRPPALLGVGEDDPALSRLLDGVDRPRYLSRGSRPAVRWLRDGVPDVAVVAGPLDDGIELVDRDPTLDAPGDRNDGNDGVVAVELGGWDREWGLVVPSGNPADVGGLADLVDRDLSFVNRTTESGLRTSLGNALAALADERGVDRRDVTEAITGYDLTARAFESPARSVSAGDADAGLGLRATAATLGLGFVPVDAQPVRVLSAPDRRGKPAVESLASELA